MPRLPISGGDDGTWGDILNDFLGVEHNSDGTQKTLDVSKGGTGAVDVATARANLGAVAETDSRLSDARTPTDGSVTDVKIAAGGLTDAAISSSAGIPYTKLALSAAMPEDRGMVSWNGDPRYMNSGAATVSGTLFVMLVKFPVTKTVTNIWCEVSSAGSGLTAGQNFISLYDATGAKKGDSSDQSGIWNSSGPKSAAISGGPFTISAGSSVYVTILANGTSPPSFGQLTTNTQGANANLSGASLLFAVNGTGFTTPPASFTPSAGTTTGSHGFWIGLS